MHNMNLRTKLLLCGIILTAVPLLVLSFILFWQNRITMEASTSESTRLALADLDHVADLVYRTIESNQEANQLLLKNSLNVAKEMVAASGVSISADKVKWEAANQVTKASNSLELPKMMIGEAWLGQTIDMKTTVPVVDQVQRLVGCTSTIFQVMNPAGDMLRIATNVAKEDGTRAIGTYIPAVQDGKPNPVIASVLKGETYTGRAVVVNAWYLTAYEPLYDKNDKIVGMIYVGIPHEKVITGLRDAIMGIKIGKSGYVFVLDSKGKYVISKDGKRNGESLWESRDAEGKPMIQEIVKKAVSLGPREIGSHDYLWKNAEDSTARLKTSKLIYFKPWDWVIGVGTYKDEFMEGVNRLSDIGNRSLYILFAIIGFAILLSAPIWLLIAHGVAKPVNRIIETLADSATTVSNASGQLATSSQSQAEGASQQAASIEEISSSLEEMSSMTRQNAENSVRAHSLMNEGKEHIGEAGGSMNGLVASMAEICTASEETSKIVKTIDEIAFQTNLLALNAAVEAARAGEAGAGFAVVADEVRNLAMRAAEAAKNTSSLIEGTVMKIREGSGQLTKTNEAFAKVAENSGKVGELISEIASASSEQAQGIEQVNKSVTEMDKIVQQNASQAEESASAAEEMDAQAEQMQTVVGQLAMIIGGERGAAQKKNGTSPKPLPAFGEPAEKKARLFGGLIERVRPGHRASEKAFPAFQKRDGDYAQQQNSRNNDTPKPQQLLKTPHKRKSAGNGELRNT
ncbi:MAG: methyl-accepting chemotaxis protein [Syntrophobacteraceae bacterium]